MMARWLMGITVAEASSRPGDIHAEPLCDQLMIGVTVLCMYIYMR